MARRIEAKHPELKTGLLAAVEEDAATPSGRWVSCNPPSSARPSTTAAPTIGTKPCRPGSSAASQLAHAAALGFLIAVALRPGQPGSFAGRLRSRPSTSGASAADVHVDPGNTEIERGTSLLGRRPFQRGRAGRGEPGRRRQVATRLRTAA